MELLPQRYQRGKLAKVSFNAALDSPHRLGAAALGAGEKVGRLAIKHEKETGQQAVGRVGKLFVAEMALSQRQIQQCLEGGRALHGQHVAEALGSVGTRSVSSCTLILPKHGIIKEQILPHV